MEEAKNANWFSNSGLYAETGGVGVLAAIAYCFGYVCHGSMFS